ncbi:hypothetical protein K7432_015548 [Basidiobolus ranarum]|uniref:Heme haloperoxidase family profile domain-containing protein n=1 Tax=Basidiobolus ranarum TaxID=34480 RepID=A0ABR2VN46_9FUNG
MWYTLKELLVHRLSFSLACLLLICLSGQLVSATLDLEDGLAIEDHHWEKPRNAIRGPCPVLNTLSNHGYLPRSGRNITIYQLRQGLEDSLNVHPLPRDVLVAVFYSHIGEYTDSSMVIPSLQDLRVHNLIEHDFSLSRKDTNLGDPVNADPELLRQLENSASDGNTFTLEDFARLSNKRILHSLKNNPNVTYTPRLKAIIQFEMGIFVDVFGKDRKVSKEAVMDVFAHERLPKDFKRPDEALLGPTVANFVEIAVRSKILNPEI